ncbi:MAG: YlxR family protein [SAR202 cluster bacterium]|nr:YlxR family protein [SAR202 cluster bacterium]
MVRTKHVPLRSCIICGTKAAKRELVRVVRTPEGECLIDPTGKRNGRGAYLCHDPGCWNKAFKGNRLSKALQVEIAETDRARLAAHGEALAAASVGEKQ